jgi:phosphoribosylglycinamide formyltransferase 1
MNQIAIFASGNGTNAERITTFFQGNKNIKIALILSNKPNAFVLERAKRLNIPSFTFSTQELKETDTVLKKLREFQIDFVVLAGFLQMIPKNIIEAFPEKIINIHPALLPKFGGEKMYGDKVHQSVIEACEKESGITIHFVNEKYDEGNIIFQAKCKVEITDTIKSLAEKVHQLEYQHYPVIIQKLLFI